MKPRYGMKKISNIYMGKTHKPADQSMWIILSARLMVGNLSMQRNVPAHLWLLEGTERKHYCLTRKKLAF